MQARTFGGSRHDAERRADELITRFQLVEVADRRTGGWSGGQCRRLDIALGLVHRPSVLFLDEPTTGLDPQSRANLWEQIGRLRDEGVTIFLTTQMWDPYICVVHPGQLQRTRTLDCQPARKAVSPVIETSAVAASERFHRNI
jgi:ABC-type multidrug transport system ATPase subunit